MHASAVPRSGPGSLGGRASANTSSGNTSDRLPAAVGWFSLGRFLTDSVPSAGLDPTSHGGFILPETILDDEGRGRR